jgi:hypothetical protein
MCENVLLDCIFLHIMLDRSLNKIKYKYLDSLTSSKFTNLLLRGIYIPPLLSRGFFSLYKNTVAHSLLYSELYSLTFVVQ